MNKNLITCALIGMVTTSFANEYESIGDSHYSAAIIATNSSTIVYGGGANVLYDNGSMVNSLGTGIGGEDESVLESTTLGMNLLGYGHQALNGNRIADDFTVSGEGWDIESIDFFSYQTNETASTITAVNLRIWDGIPGDPGSTVVFGDISTNRLSSTGYTGILRVDEPTSGTTNNRQIAVSNVTVGITLPPGTYWLDWQSDGTGGSGPWAPPIAILGQNTTGNGLQSLDGGVTYGLAEDSGSLTQQGFPFVIYGVLPQPVTIPTLSFYGLMLLGLFALLFGRRFIRQ